MVCGNMCEAENRRKFTESPLKVLSCRSMLFHPPEFIPAESMEAEVPCMQELQGVPVPDGQFVVQGEH
jgi:hypothetical protein